MRVQRKLLVLILGNSMSIISGIYKALKYYNDVKAIRNDRIKERIYNRVLGKIFGRAFK